MIIEVLILMSGYVISRDATTGAIIPTLSGNLIEVFHKLSNLTGRTTAELGYVRELNYKMLLEDNECFEKVTIGSDFSNFIKIVSESSSTENTELSLLLIHKLQQCSNLSNAVADVIIEFMQEYNLTTLDKTF